MLLQIPGGIELMVILLVMILIFGIPVLIVAVLGTMYLRDSSGADPEMSEQIQELQAEIAALRADLDDESSDDTGDS